MTLAHCWQEGVDVRAEKEGLAGGLLVAPVLLFVVTLLMAENRKTCEAAHARRGFVDLFKGLEN